MLKLRLELDDAAGRPLCGVLANAAVDDLVRQSDEEFSARYVLPMIAALKGQFRDLIGTHIIMHQLPEGGFRLTGAKDGKPIDI